MPFSGLPRDALQREDDEDGCWDDDKERSAEEAEGEVAQHLDGLSRAQWNGSWNEKSFSREKFAKLIEPNDPPFCNYLLPRFPVPLLY